MMNEAHGGLGTASGLVASCRRLHDRSVMEVLEFREGGSRSGRRAGTEGTHEAAPRIRPDTAAAGIQDKDADLPTRTWGTLHEETDGAGSVDEKTPE